MLRLCAFAVFLLLPHAAMAAMPDALRERPVQTIPQWPDFSARQEKAVQDVLACEKDKTACANADMERWAKLISGLRSENKLRQIITVNRWFNRLIYKFDGPPVNNMDHWSDTGELLTSRGDCEDFALGKYSTLRALGFTAEELKVTMVYDKVALLNHAVLMVYISGTRYLLDINSDDMEPSPMDYRYRTIYAFNEHTAWFY